MVEKNVKIVYNNIWSRKKQDKGEVIILKFKIRSYTKDATKMLEIMILGLIIILAITLIKYKPVYKVIVSDNKLGYISNISKFENRINTEIYELNEANVDDVQLSEKPSYELALVNRNSELNENEIISELKNSAIVTYRFYAVTLDNETKAYVDNIDQAEEVVNSIKSGYSDKDNLNLNLQIIEKYTNNKDEVKVDTVQVAESNIQTTLTEIVNNAQAAEEAAKEAEKNSAVVNGITLASKPLDGTITSRFGEVSSLRSGAHTGLDIARPIGSDIKVAGDGVVTFTAYSGSYGKLVKVDHGNGVETWYGHCSKIYAKVGQQVSAGDVIAAVGTTGNSTGPHLHFEIRINNTPVNPQKYFYK